MRVDRELLVGEASAPDPTPVIELMEHHTAAVGEATEALEVARRRLTDARAAVPGVPAGERDRLLRLDPQAAREAAKAVAAAVERARDAQASLRPRPAPSAEARGELEDASYALRAARADHEARWRRLGLRLVQATGVALVAAGVGMTRRLPLAATLVAAAVPFAIALAWSLRVARRERGRLRRAETAAGAVVVRILGALAPTSAGPGADPAEILADLDAAHRASVEAIAEADGRLAEAHRRWLEVGGDADPDTVEADLALASKLRPALEELEAAEAEMQAAHRHEAAARHSWCEAATAAGFPGRTPEEAGTLLEQLHAQRARRDAAIRALADEQSAQRLTEARDRLDLLLDAG